MAKGPEAFRSISEAADALGVPQHVLRFWETKFAFVRPMKRAGGRRFYRPQDIAVLGEVRRLLHEEGYTIKGVQKLHRELGSKNFVGGARPHDDAGTGGADLGELAAPADRPIAFSADTRQRLAATLEELVSLKARLDRLLGET